MAPPSAFHQAGSPSHRGAGRGMGRAEGIAAALSRPPRRPSFGRGHSWLDGERPHEYLPRGTVDKLICTPGGRRSRGMRRRGGARAAPASKVRAQCGEWEGTQPSSWLANTRGIVGERLTAGLRERCGVTRNDIEFKPYACKAHDPYLIDWAGARAPGRQCRGVHEICARRRKARGEVWENARGEAASPNADARRSSAYCVLRGVCADATPPRRWRLPFTEENGQVCAPSRHSPRR